ncbi:hypothetical protein GCM10027614_74150 [Micromonospora vulcania]
MSALGGPGGRGKDHPLGVRRLRIAVLVKTNAGGMWLLPQVEELRHRGHEVTVVLPRGAGRLTDELEHRGIEVLASPYDFTLGRSAPLGLLRLRALLRRLRPDVVQYHLIASAYAVRLATLGLPVRRVHMVAGPAYLESRLVRSVERFLWRMDDVVICGCRYASTRYGELDCPPQRRPVAVYGVDTDAFSPDTTGPDQRAKLRAELGIDQNAFLAVMVSYVYPPKRLVHSGRGVKGHEVLLAAWRTFRRRQPDAHLLLVGGGWTAAGRATGGSSASGSAWPATPGSPGWSRCRTFGPVTPPRTSASPRRSATGRARRWRLARWACRASSARPVACPRRSPSAPAGWCRRVIRRRWRTRSARRTSVGSLAR